MTPVVDAVRGVSVESHQAAIERIAQAGARPITWVALMYELQRDWNRQKQSNRLVGGDRYRATSLHPCVSVVGRLPTDRLYWQFDNPHQPVTHRPLKSLCVARHIGAEQGARDTSRLSSTQPVTSCLAFVMSAQKSQS